MKKTSILAFIIFSVFLVVMPNANATASLRVDHGYRAILHDIPVDNACLTPTQVRSRRPIRTCIHLERTIETQNDSREKIPTWTCVAEADVTLAYPRQVETRECTRKARPLVSDDDTSGACLEWSYGTLTLPRSIEIRVTPFENRESPTEVTTTKIVTFPDCP